VLRAIKISGSTSWPAVSVAWISRARQKVKSAFGSPWQGMQSATFIAQPCDGGRRLSRLGAGVGRLRN
jgi:hypothetical protein